MRILLLDNHDSFTWNLAHDLERFDAEVTVVREVNTPLDGFDGVVLSPGPGLPSEHPQLIELVAQCIECAVPMLGVCLGMQAIVEHFGGRLRNLAAPLHGVARRLEVVGDCPVLGGEADEVGHYHSWVADENTWPDVLEVTARERQDEKSEESGESGNEDMILAMRHRSLPVYGVQFHPESVLTPGGRAMLGRWLADVEKVQGQGT